MNQRHYGPKIGSHLGQPIYSTIEAEGHKYVFDRLAECDRDGCPLQQLQKNEILFQPGLIYRAA